MCPRASRWVQSEPYPARWFNPDNIPRLPGWQPGCTGTDSNKRTHFHPKRLIFKMVTRWVRAERVVFMRVAKRARFADGALLAAHQKTDREGISQGCVSHRFN